MEKAAAFARRADKVLNFVVSLLLLLALLYAGYALWDTVQIYDRAGTDAALLAYKPQLSADGSNPTLSELYAQNNDVRAWLTIDETHIDYPVLQGNDNTKYINADVYGNYSLPGSVFLDWRCAGDFSDGYSLLYGHHMDGGLMFGDLENFLAQDYLASHPHGTLYLADKTYTIELFACLSIDAYDNIIFNPSAKTDMSALLARIGSSAESYYDIGVTPDDKLIGLSTCSDSETNGRTVLFGRLVAVTYTPQGDKETTS